jgi:hypothetical protein
VEEALQRAGVAERNAFSLAAVASLNRFDSALPFLFSRRCAAVCQ